MQQESYNNASLVNLLVLIGKLSCTRILNIAVVCLTKARTYYCAFHLRYSINSTFYFPEFPILLRLQTTTMAY